MANTTAPILLACHGALSSNSGRHLLGLGRALYARGFNIQLATPTVTEAERSDAQPLPLFRFTDCLESPSTARPALVHLWTPRLRMEHFYQALCQHHQQPIPYLVHLEDNERILLQDSLNLSDADYQALANGQTPTNAEAASNQQRLANTIVPSHTTTQTQPGPPFPDNRMHPHSGNALLRNAAGITALTRPLLETLPSPRPSVQFWPGYEPLFERPSLAAALRLRAQLEIPSERYVTAYTGNVHASNLAEVRELYRAVALVNRAGLPLTLLRTGLDGAGQGIAEALADLQQHVIHLGQLPREQLPILLRAADILVQPGRVNTWNRCRVPSKLPEYLAVGRPVLLPCVNLGELLSHGDNALILDDASAEPIAEALLHWLPRTQALLKIGTRASLFARRQLRWNQAADRVEPLYTQLLRTQGQTVPTRDPANQRPSPILDGDDVAHDQISTTALRSQV